MRPGPPMACGEPVPEPVGRSLPGSEAGDVPPASGHVAGSPPGGASSAGASADDESPDEGSADGESPDGASPPPSRANGLATWTSTSSAPLPPVPPDPPETVISMMILTVVPDPEPE